MGNITKISVSRQSKLRELTLTEIEDIIEENETLLYKRIDGSLGMVTKIGGTIIDINPGGDVIKNLPIPELPTVFPDPNKAYALSVVRDGQNFKIVWALVDTGSIDYNEP